MSVIASQITSLTIVYSIVYSDADQRKHQSSASLAFVRGIHRGPVNSPHKWPVTRKMFPFDDVIVYRVNVRLNYMFIHPRFDIRYIALVIKNPAAQKNCCWDICRNFACWENVYLELLRFFAISRDKTRMLSLCIGNRVPGKFNTKPYANSVSVEMDLSEDHLSHERWYRYDM